MWKWNCPPELARYSHHSMTKRPMRPMAPRCRAQESVLPEAFQPKLTVDPEQRCMEPRGAWGPGPVAATYCWSCWLIRSHGGLKKKGWGVKKKGYPYGDWTLKWLVFRNSMILWNKWERKCVFFFWTSARFVLDAQSLSLVGINRNLQWRIEGCGR